jgi:LmbE family N-acetylglucosaminyl deacetylase
MKVLFIFAHPDDESFGPAGTIMTHLGAGDDVTVVSLCKGNRPGAEVEDARSKQFRNNSQAMGVNGLMYNQSDCLMTREETSKAVEQLVNDIQPSTVYTHFIGDVHQDHRLVAECVTVACRPKPESSVTKLLMCEIPASTEWAFGTHGDFSPNVYIDVTPYAGRKAELLGYYETEVYNFPDARSVDSMMLQANYRGKQSGVSYAEAFQLVFDLRRTVQ